MFENFYPNSCSYIRNVFISELHGKNIAVKITTKVYNYGRKYAHV